MASLSAEMSDWREFAAKISDFLARPDAPEWQETRRQLMKCLASTPKGRMMIREAIRHNEKSLDLEASTPNPAPVVVRTADLPRWKPKTDFDALTDEV